MHRVFFEKFMKWYSEIVFPLFIKMPTMEELGSNSAEYVAAGFPGTVCFVDCVHVRFWGVAANLKQVSTGKEHFPLLSNEGLLRERCGPKYCKV